MMQENQNKIREIIKNNTHEQMIDTILDLVDELNIEQLRNKQTNQKINEVVVGEIAIRSNTNSLTRCIKEVNNLILKNKQINHLNQLKSFSYFG